MRTEPKITGAAGLVTSIVVNTGVFPWSAPEMTRFPESVSEIPVTASEATFAGELAFLNEEHSGFRVDPQSPLKVGDCVGTCPAKLGPGSH